jgi:hypothetical protein
MTDTVPVFWAARPRTQHTGHTPLDMRCVARGGWGWDWDWGSINRTHARLLLLLLLAYRASCWSCVLCRLPMACGADSRTSGSNPNSNAPETQTQPQPLTEHTPKPALRVEGRETETPLCVAARYPPRGTGAGRTAHCCLCLACS